MKLLIPLSYLNEACALSLNTDEKKYKMILKLAQDNLEDILGPEFFEEIEDQYDPSSDTLSADNDTLYEDYIKDYLAWQAYFYYLKFSQSTSTPTGERQFEDENSSMLSDIKLASLEKNVLAQAVHYKNRMINFLRLEQSKDSTKYPKWEDSCKEEFGFAISSVSKTPDEIVSVNKAITSNE